MEHSPYGYCYWLVIGIIGWPIVIISQLLLSVVVGQLLTLLVSCCGKLLVI